MSLKSESHLELVPTIACPGGQVVTSITCSSGEAVSFGANAPFNCGDFGEGKPRKLELPVEVRAAVSCESSGRLRLRDLDLAKSESGRVGVAVEGKGDIDDISALWYIKLQLLTLQHLCHIRCGHAESPSIHFSDSRRTRAPCV